MLAVVLGVVLGCTSGSKHNVITEPAYELQLRQVLTTWDQRAEALARKPFPIKSTWSESARRVGLAPTVAEMAQIYFDAGRSMRNLKPPPKYELVNRRAKDWFEGTGSDLLEWSRLIKENSPREREFGRNSTAREMSRLEPFVYELEKVDGPQPRLRSLLSQLRSQ
jgi:hypothetical protein